MRYELRLAKLIERGSKIEQYLGLPVEMLAAMGKLGSFDAASEAFEEKAKAYPWVGDRAAVIIQVPLKLMETVVILNRGGASPSKLIEMLRSGHLGIWPRNGSLKEMFLSAQGTFPLRAAKFH
jgi:hypothetical protein